MTVRNWGPTLLIAAVLVVGAISGAVTVGPLPAADSASAAGSVIKDFESGVGDFYEAGGSDWSQSTNRVREGSYSGRNNPSSGVTSRLDIGSTSADSLSIWFNANSVSADNQIEYENSDADIFGVHLGQSGNLDTLSDTDTGIDYNKNQWYKLTFKPDWGSNTYDLELRDIDGNVVGTATGLSFNSGSGSVNQMSWIAFGDDDVYYDYFVKNGKSIGQKVSGNISNSDRNGIDGATVELLDSSDSVIKTTTTNSTGGYKFDAVSDGTDYEIRASASGYQNKTSASFDISGAPKTVDLSLFESGTFVREFQLDQTAQLTYPPSMSELTVSRFDRALELPLPGGTTFSAGPGTWNEVATKDINAYGEASVRLENGEPYRVEVEAVSGTNATRWESLGWRANKSRADPFLISVGSQIDSSGNATATATATPTDDEDGPVDTDGPLEPPTDPFDRDRDGYYYDYPDTPDTNFTAPDAGDGFGPRLAGECLQTDGSEGVLVEYWDPSFETTSLEYNVSSGNQSYAGEREFTTAVGYTTWCISDGLTGNASDAPGDTTLEGNYTSGGETFNYTDDLGSNALLGAPLGGGGGGGVGGGGSPSTGQTAVGVALLGAAGYVAYRRFGSDGPGSGPSDPGVSGGESGGVLPWRGGD